KILVSEKICNPEKIQKVHFHQRGLKPSQKSSRMGRPQSIESFGLRIGEDVIRKIVSFPQESALKTQYALEGSDFIRFKIQPNKNTTENQEIESFEKIANHFKEIW